MTERQKDHFAEVVQLVEQSAHDPKLGGFESSSRLGMIIADR
jgi:hypothetical protein